MPSRFEPRTWRTDVDLNELRPPPDDDLTDQLWAQLWLPWRIRGTHVVDTPFDGERLLVGSIEGLVATLDAINARTWKAGPDQTSGWSRRGPLVDDDGESIPLLRPWAEFGFSVFHALAQTALREQLPMHLDW